MGYLSDYEKALKKGNVEKVGQVLKKWEVENDFLCGRVLDVTDFDRSTYDSEVKVYTIQTDDGVFSTILGSATDNKLANKEIVGRMIHIIYRGKVQLKNGNRMNDFEIGVW